MERWRSGDSSAKVETLTVGPERRCAVGLGAAGLGLLRRPSQPIRARAARSRSVSSWARVSRCVCEVTRPARWGSAAAIAARAAASRSAGAVALVALARGVLEAVMRSRGVLCGQGFAPLASDSTGNGVSCNVSGDQNNL